MRTNHENLRFTTAELYTRQVEATRDKRRHRPYRHSPLQGRTQMRGGGTGSYPLQWLHHFITYTVLCYVLYSRFLKYLHVVCCVLSVSSKDDDDVDDADDDSPQN